MIRHQQRVKPQRLSLAGAIQPLRPVAATSCCTPNRNLRTGALIGNTSDPAPA